MIFEANGSLKKDKWTGVELYQFINADIKLNPWFKFMDNKYEIVTIVPSWYSHSVICLTDESHPILAKDFTKIISIQVQNKYPKNMGDLVIAEYNDLESFKKDWEVETVNPKFNCHGYALANSQIWIDDNSSIARVLADEYDRLYDLNASPMADDVIMYVRNAEFIHSAVRRIDNNGIFYEYKAGVFGIKRSDNIELPEHHEYQNTDKHIYRRN